ncbi:MAG: 6-O-methylguanine DNA methyltransferase [Acidobacteria bacterium]|nr:MAG: 6-O-methylguanine DNA methyltransferase [Acidobacteriota bacterium]
MDLRTEDYARIEQAILFLESKHNEQPSLEAAAQSVGLSDHHFQRLFRRWAGISPKRFVQFLTLDHAKRLLRESRSVLDATFEAGLSSPGRLHDLFVHCEAVTPGEFQRQGAGLTISYGFFPTPFGECLLATTERGICSLLFVTAGGRRATLADLASRWPGARLAENSPALAAIARKIFDPAVNGTPRPLTLLLKGTNFQIKVWEALLRVPLGAVTSYGDLARRIGQPAASRAVGAAVGSNPIAYLIPCHRVIRGLGMFGNYGGGVTRKKAMLAWEAAEAERAHAPSPPSEEAPR